MIKYVIWGAGTNGTLLHIFSEKGSVVAFIDEYSKESSFNDIPIIKYQDYIDNYMNYPIVISVEKCDEIINKLEKEGIFQYYVYWNEYCDVIKFISQIDHEKFVKYCANIHEQIILSGNSLLNVFVYNVLEKYSIDVCYENVKNSKQLEWLQEKQQVVLCKDKKKCMDIIALMNNSTFCEHPELVKFKNIHNGKRCFIVATGPSLKVSDLNTLYEHNEICISVNGIFKGFSSTKWRPDYYIISDPNGVIQWKKNIIEMDVKEKFVSDVAFLFPEKVPSNIYKWHMIPLKEKGVRPLFSDDFSKGSYNGDTITYDGALQLAVYMGFDEIYLLGVDCCQPKNGEQHFVKNYQDEKHKNAIQHPEIQVLAYESAKEYADLRGIHIYNATRGGELEVFERVDFDTLF